MNDEEEVLDLALEESIPTGEQKMRRADQKVMAALVVFLLMAMLIRVVDELSPIYLEEFEADVATACLIAPGLSIQFVLIASSVNSPRLRVVSWAITGLLLLGTGAVFTLLVLLLLQ